VGRERRRALVDGPHERSEGAGGKSASDRMGLGDALAAISAIETGEALAVNGR
jgi:hypothetical protein